MTPNGPDLRRVMVASVSMLFLVSCTTQGDFGRDKPSVFNDEILPSIRKFAALAKEEPVSNFAYTKKEQLLRTYSRRIGRDTASPNFFSALAPVQPAQPPSPHQKNKAGPQQVVEEIVVELPENVKSNPLVLSSETEEDLSLIRRARNLSRSIVADDQLRSRRLVTLKNASQSDRDNVTVRARENLQEIDYIQRVARMRVKRYRRAIDGMSIADPQLNLKPARTSVKRLEIELDRFSRQRRFEKKPMPRILYDTA